MKIDIPSHGVDSIAKELAWQWRLRNDAQANRNSRDMEIAERRIEGMQKVLDWLGPRQANGFSRLANEHFKALRGDALLTTDAERGASSDDAGTGGASS